MVEREAGMVGREAGMVEGGWWSGGGDGGAGGGDGGAGSVGGEAGDGKVFSLGNWVWDVWVEEVLLMAGKVWVAEGTVGI